MFLCSVGFVVASLWIWSIAETQNPHPPLFAKGIALFGVSFFGLCGVHSGVKLFDSEPGLTIDNEGIVDNSSAVSAGRIPWEEVIGLRESSIAGQRFIIIDVLDPQKYVKRCGFFVRLLNAANTKMTGSPINLSTTSLRVGFDELMELLTEAFERRIGADRTTEDEIACASAALQRLQSKTAAAMKKHGADEDDIDRVLQEDD